MRHPRHISLKTVRAVRVRRSLKSKDLRPRLHVYRSNQHLSAQIIDDLKGKTLVSVNEGEIKDIQGTKTQKAVILGDLIGKKAKTKKITQVCFDRGHYRYHGRIEAFASAARKAGLSF